MHKARRASFSLATKCSLSPPLDPHKPASTHLQPPTPLLPLRPPCRRKKPPSSFAPFVRIQNPPFRPGSRVHGLGCKVQGPGYRVRGRWTPHRAYNKMLIPAGPFKTKSTIMIRQVQMASTKIMTIKHACFC